MFRMRLYRVVMGSLGIGVAIFGMGLVASFFGYHRPNSVPALPTGPVGHYFVAFTGCALIGWGGGMLGAARDPFTSRTVATTTVFVLVLMAVIRMAAWMVGDYSAWLGEAARGEAAAFLVVALLLVWLRPTVAECVHALSAEGSS